MAETKPPLNILLAGPRGFCAGVDRAIKIVEEALNRYGAPVYVRHEIVHNRFVVESLEAKGAVFVEELHQVPEGAHVVFSAHGVPKAVPEDAKARNLIALDATCPLVSKVHREVERHAAKGRHLLLIGHAGHVEVIGTMGQVPDGTVTLIEDAAQARSVQPADKLNLAYATQTTLSVDDTAEIVEILRTRFPAIEGPKREDICYATTNRQAAVRAIAAASDLVLVIGAPNSSNSLRLVEVATRAGAPRAQLIRRGAEVAGIDLAGVATLGLSAGASAPEVLVDETIAALRKNYAVTVREIVVTQEDVTFRLPAALTA
jgi:4-hydroxy-3-methylbut-2-en-1-yl diphosphate reductase